MKRITVNRILNKAPSYHDSYRIYLRYFVVPLVTDVTIILESYHVICLGKLIADTKLGDETRIVTAFLVEYRLL